MEPLVLGIETSCDETGVGIVRGHTLLADAVAPATAVTRPASPSRAASPPRATWPSTGSTSRSPA